MRPHPLRRWTIPLLAVPIIVAAFALRPAVPAAAPSAPAEPALIAEAAAAEAEPQAAAPVVVAAARRKPTATPTATTTPTTAPTATPSVQPTPTARPAGTPLRVGVQVGHWKSNELPDELARLRTSTGAHAAGYTEAEVNLNIAQRVVELLQSRGMVADLLPATIPPGYDADAFVAIHADGSTSTSSRGFKLATPWRTSRAAQHLADAMTDEYAKATRMPQDGAITFNMRGYYAFNNRRHVHAIAPTTPAVIIETGFLTNATDRNVIINNAQNVAIGIANGIIRYLSERDPNDGGALLPPDFKTQRPLDPAGIDVHAAPSDKAKVLKHADADSRLFVFQERDGWYQVFVRSEARIVGWVRKDQVTETNEPPPAPPPATDS